MFCTSSEEKLKFSLHWIKMINCVTMYRQCVQCIDNELYFLSILCKNEISMHKKKHQKIDLHIIYVVVFMYIHT